MPSLRAFDSQNFGAARGSAAIASSIIANGAIQPSAGTNWGSIMARGSIAAGMARQVQLVRPPARVRGKDVGRGKK